MDIFSYRVKKYIGSYAVAMGGIDAIISPPDLVKIPMPSGKASAAIWSFSERALIAKRTACAEA